MPDLGSEQLCGWVQMTTGHWFVKSTPSLWSTTSQPQRAKAFQLNCEGMEETWHSHCAATKESNEDHVKHNLGEKKRIVWIYASLVTQWESKASRSPLHIKEDCPQHLEIHPERGMHRSDHKDIEKINKELWQRKYDKSKKNQFD